MLICRALALGPVTQRESLRDRLLPSWSRAAGRAVSAALVSRSELVHHCPRGVTSLQVFSPPDKVNATATVVPARDEYNNKRNLFHCTTSPNHKLTRCLLRLHCFKFKNKLALELCSTNAFLFLLFPINALESC